MLELRKRYTSPETGTWIEIVEGACTHTTERCCA